MLPIADYNLGDGLVTVVAIFFLVIWFWILVTVISDLFRDHELSGWLKAAWMLFLLIVPFFAAFIYLIFRGNGMRDRSIKAQAEMREHLIAQSGASPASEIAKLDGLKKSGSITDAEYKKLKAKIIS
jgi:ABC-type transport system involved in cytochrome bd biosynthesis fused ATPase/permease subunit